MQGLELICKSVCFTLLNADYSTYSWSHVAISHLCKHTFYLSPIKYTARLMSVTLPLRLTDFPLAPLPAQRRGTGQDEEDRVPYTKIAMQRYIRCARAIKPELTPEAQNAIVKGYVRLRQGDAAPGSSTAYKITVRQLEAMVRLSEAIARLHMEDKIRVPHVKKAMKLLSQSIIHVDSQVC